jgi:hypothetical protein
MLFIFFYNREAGGVNEESLHLTRKLRALFLPVTRETLSMANSPGRVTRHFPSTSSS